MKKVMITVLKKVCHQDLIERYENPIEHTCDMREGQVFLSHIGERPEGMCDSAWEVMAPFVKTLAQGGGNFYDGWMRDPYSAMISCNDGFRPVSFLVEVAPSDRELSMLFEPQPDTWGLRGDPYFWAYLKDKAKGMPLPTPDRLEAWIKEEFKSVSGVELTLTAMSYVEQFAHGGMSSGGLAGDWWLEDGIPLLKNRLPR